ncbi:retromer subunit VPS29 [Sporobolomyces salmoneus]|uniref:retromer subunit VPS29 n=1 Tax=Sporobolomyces salmoneus TaxID=183962 RepID=UPI00316FCC1C
MVLVLVLGDLHIPNRSHDLPSKFKKLLVPGKISQILSTGNITDRETWDYLKSVAPDLRGVKGDWDETSSLPPSMTVQHGPLRIGVIHGHQVVPLGDPEMLAATARKMDVDVLISGATHRFEAFESDNRFFLNPGSATGAFSPTWTPPPPAPAPAVSSPTKESPPSSSSTTTDPSATQSPQKETETTKEDQEDEEEESSPTPSFALLDIQGNVVVTYVYTEKNGDVSVEKMEFRKHVS